MKGELQRIHCKKVLSFCILVMSVSLALLVIPNRTLSQELELSIGNYTLVSQKRVDRTKFDYTYRANLTNNGGANALNVTATLTSNASNIAVIDGSLSFGNVPASSTTVSADTFTIRVDRLYTFKESDLNWKFAGELENGVFKTIGLGGGVINNAVDLSVFEFLPSPGAPFIGRSFGNSGLCGSG